jgi:ketosteroid isomerase-like protein
MKPLLTLFSIFLLISCSSNFTSGGDPQQKIDLVHQYIDAITKQDVEVMKNLLSDDFKSYGPAMNTEVSKSQNISDWERGWEERIVSMKYKRMHSGLITIEKGKSAGEWVTEWGQVTALYKDGKTVKFWFNGLYKVADGMITEARVVYDNMDILTQLGYKFMPPSDIIDESGH